MSRCYIDEFHDTYNWVSEGDLFSFQMPGFANGGEYSGNVKIDENGRKYIDGVPSKVYEGCYDYSVVPYTVFYFRVYDIKKGLVCNEVKLFKFSIKEALNCIVETYPQNRYICELYDVMGRSNKVSLK